MNLYLISQDVNNDYDTYDSAVVCAESEPEARLIHPNSAYQWREDAWWYVDDDKAFIISTGTWVKPGQVDVKLIGKAAPGIAKGVVCASFNAG